MREDVAWISLGGVMLLAAAQASHAAAVLAAKTCWALGKGQRGGAWCAACGRPAAVMMIMMMLCVLLVFCSLPACIPSTAPATTPACYPYTSCGGWGGRGRGNVARTAGVHCTGGANPSRNKITTRGERQLANGCCRSSSKWTRQNHAHTHHPSTSRPPKASLDNKLCNPTPTLVLAAL